MKLSLTFLLLMMAASVASASVPTVPAPEIDGTSLGTGAALLGGAVMILRSRLK